VVSLVLFAIFATFFNAWDIFGAYSGYVPIVLLFALGVWFVVRGFIRRK
jgi:Sec-independent protein secretion pathway component TatC